MSHSRYCSDFFEPKTLHQCLNAIPGADPDVSGCSLPEAELVVLSHFRNDGVCLRPQRASGQRLLCREYCDRDEPSWGAHLHHGARLCITVDHGFTPA